MLSCVKRFSCPKLSFLTSMIVGESVGHVKAPDFFWADLHALFEVTQLPSLKLTEPLKRWHPKKKVVFQPSVFRGYVCFRAGRVFDSISDMKYRSVRVQESHQLLVS